MFLMIMKIILFLMIFSIFSMGMISMTQTVLADEHETDDENKYEQELEIKFKRSDAIVLGLGALGGLTTAGLGIARNKKKIEAANALLAENEQDKIQSLKFDGHKFGRTLLIAILTAVPLAIASTYAFTELNLLTMFLIYTASLGTSSVIKTGSK